MQKENLILSIENLDKFIENIKSRTLEYHKENVLLTYSQNVDIPNITTLLSNLQLFKQKFFYWNKPDSLCLAIGIESIITIENSGKEHASDAENKINYWKNRHYYNLSEEELKSIPLFMGGMKFSPDTVNESTIWNDYSDSDWFIPKILLKVHGNNAKLLINLIVDTSTFELKHLHDDYKDCIDLFNKLLEPAELTSDAAILDSNLNNKQERTEWNEKVNAALERISEKNLSKIVLSRKVTCILSGEPVIYNLLCSLATSYPKCYIFAYAKGDSVFFGASPEKLAKISEGWVEADALAGSTPRGKTEEEDTELANELLASKKNLAEQNAVVQFIINSFKGFTTDLEYKEEPVIRKLSNIQHLWTEIRAKLKSDKSIFSVLKEIHPTPAICGVPWSSALTFIETTEGYNRGLYAGIIGWFNFDNQGEFAVGIRSALLKGNELHAFAGCGIVEGSDADSEFMETELKLKPILSLFSNEKADQP